MFVLFEIGQHSYPISKISNGHIGDKTSKQIKGPIMFNNIKIE